MKTETRRDRYSRVEYVVVQMQNEASSVNLKMFRSTAPCFWANLGNHYKV